MPKTGPRYSKEEFSRRGEEIFERTVKAAVKHRDPGDFVAIDIETGDYEVDADEMAATDCLHAKIPDAQVWLRRVNPWETNAMVPMNVIYGSDAENALTDGQAARIRYFERP